MPKEVKRSLVFMLLTIFFFTAPFNGFSTFASLYMEKVYGLLGGEFATVMMGVQLTAMASYLPSDFIAGRIGRKKTMLIGVGMFLVAFFGLLFTRSLNVFTYICFSLLGYGFGFVNVQTLVMILEMAKDSDIGKYTGIYYACFMGGQILAPILAGATIENLGYNYLFPNSLLVSFITLIMLLNVRHGEAKAIPPKNLLESFDVED
jgi:MFS family permease